LSCPGPSRILSCSTLATPFRDFARADPRALSQLQNKAAHRPWDRRTKKSRARPPKMEAASQARREGPQIEHFLHGCGRQVVGRTTNLGIAIIDNYETICSCSGIFAARPSGSSTARNFRCCPATTDETFLYGGGRRTRARMDTRGQPEKSQTRIVSPA
jgi:hypothetical protein